MDTLQVDVAVVGAGSAGLTAYRAARSSGARTVLIEAGAHGTMCARVGCMPSKLLIAAAEAAHAARSAQAFGVRVQGVHIDGAQVMQRVRDERDRFVGYVLDQVRDMPEADKLQGRARFISDQALLLDDALQVQARAFVVATGSTPVVPDMYRDLGDLMVLNDDLFDWADLPRRVLVVGAGAIGMELGLALARLGVQVSVIGRGDGLAGISDPQVRQSARQAYEAELELHLNTEVHQIRREGQVAVAHFAAQGGPQQEGRYDAVLVATGRKPSLQGLGLEHTSVGLDRRGRPEIDLRTLRAGSSSIYFAGDVTGQRAVQHEAANEGRIAGANAARHPHPAEHARTTPLSIVFTDPQIAHVGLRYADLPEGAVAGAVDFSGQGRARIMGRNHGVLRIYAENKTGKLLGAEMAAPAAEHLAHLLAWACQQELSVGRLLEMPFYHPVLEEALRTALRDAMRQLGR